MKAVHLLVNSVLPPDLRNNDQTYDIKSLNKILHAVAFKHPDQFADVEKKISDIGRKASYYQGETITLNDLTAPFDRTPYFQEMEAAIKALPKNKDFESNRIAIMQKYNDLIEKANAKSSLEQRNNIAMSVLSGARGKGAQLKAMVATPGTFSDYKGRVVPVFSKESFAEGVRPAVFLASTNGARASVVSTKSSTAKGGDLAKQLASSAADLVVRKEDCGTDNGIELHIDDKSMRGRVLAKDAYGLKAGTVIGRNELDKLKKAGADSVVVRSPQTCSVPNGLCAHCVGRFYNGSKMPKVGDSIGLLASSTVGEPITQMALCINELQPVSMADGSVKPIKDIKVGDMVLGADKEGNTFPVKVLNTYDQGIRKTRVYTIKLLETTEEVEVSCTKDHKFLNEYGDIVPVKELVESPSTSLCTDRGLGVIVSISPEEDTHCRDIEVDHSDHLFVLDGGIITSNSAKHTAGMSTGKKSYSGLGTIIQFTQSPEAFKDRGSVSELDGKVTSVEEAPQGGMFVTVGDKKHYVLPGHEVYVKPGDTVEAGDQLAEGLIDPEDIVRLKGLGEGQLYYSERLHQMLQDSGAGTDRRNTEVLARGAIRHIKITDPEGMGSYLPDDVVDYNAAQKTYKVPETAKEMSPKESVGKYLQKPYLHYTVGTRVTPSVAKKLAKNNYDSLLVDDKAPGFEPHMVRLRTASHTNPDWMASLATSSIAKQLNEGATRGDDTNIISNPDFRPRLAVGENFGKNVGITGEF
jgi:hypothetical protein